MRRFRNSRRLAAIGAAVGLAACQSPPNMDVERQWSDAARRLNLFAFYPMTEDVRVGNVYLHAPPRSGAEAAPRFSLMRVGSFRRDDVMRELTSQQRDRIAIQSLPEVKPADTGASAPGAPRAIATAPCAEGEFGHADSICRLRLQRSAMPALHVGRITTGQLDAAGIFGNFGANIGLAASSQTAVNITLRNVQEMTLDGWRANEMIARLGAGFANIAHAEDLIAMLGQLRPELVPAACNGDHARLARERVEFLLVTRVMYAGGIEYSFSDNAEFAIRAALDIQSAMAGQPQAPVIPARPGGDTAGRSNPGVPQGNAEDPAKAGERLAAALAAITGGGGANARAGVSTSLGVGTFGRLALNENFNRPIAVGAGSRVRFAFHEMIAGPAGALHNGRPLVEHRARYAVDHCRRAMAVAGEVFDEGRLRGVLSTFSPPALAQADSRDQREPTIGAPVGAGIPPAAR